MIKPKVIIIMSTYNGERYLKQQLESLLKQTHTSDIIIRDDGSSDQTVSILKDYSAQHSCIYLHKEEPSHKGLRDSYLILLNEAIKHTPDYICYADQDDVWLADKTEKLLAHLKQHEKENEPALVFSDVHVVDEKLNIIHASLSKLQQLENHRAITLKKLLFYCPALGCTIMLNKPLFQLIASMPEHGKSLNPDKWALILAAIKGKIIYLPEVTLLYRQHAANTVGAMLGIKRKTWTLANIDFLKTRYQTALNQAQDIMHIPFLSAHDKSMLARFNKLFTANYLSRLYQYIAFITAPPGWKRKYGLALSFFLKYKIEQPHA